MASAAASKPSNETFENILSRLESAVDKIDETLISSFETVNYDELSTENKIRYDLFLAYSLNSLMWLYLRTSGEDPAQTVLKTEINRIKECMTELQRVIDRKTIMPKIDQGAAKRFVQHGLWDPNNPAKKAKHTVFKD